jgi:uncharacterized protein YlxW (UPF0749 family)
MMDGLSMYPTDDSRATVPSQRGGDSLADVLERVLDKGIVVAGDIAINVLDIELLTIKLRLLIASVDKAREMGIDWWQADPALSSRARALHQENTELQERVRRLEQLAAASSRSQRENEGNGQPLEASPGRRGDGG